MTDTNQTDATPESKRLGLLAQFDGPDELIAAAEKATDDGYTKVEAYSPFAVIGIDEALKAKGTILPWIVLAMGLTGCLGGLAMQLYMNGFEFPGAPWGLSGYEFLISAKPGTSSIPAFIPVTFETTILLSAFGAFFGMLILNQLPKLSNPLFRNERFASATTDGFFLFVDVADSKYAETETEAYLKSIGSTAVEAIDDVVTGHAVPSMIYLAGAAAATFALLPPLYIWASSSTTSTIPRISFFKDMESQAKFKAQTTTALFEDGRAARPPVFGTISRGSGKDDLRLYYGIEPESNLADLYRQTDLTFVSSDSRVPARFAADESDDSSGGDAEDDSTGEEAAAAGEGEEPEVEEPNWSKSFPESLDLNSTFMERGEQRYNIHCAACHGLAGNGDGLVSQRALALKQGAWVQPSSLHIEAVTTQPVGRIFNTISNGIRKMPGYKEHISPTDRWAIVLYMQALQRSQAASADDLPKEKLRELSNLNK